MIEHIDIITLKRNFYLKVLQVIKGKIYLHPLFNPITNRNGPEEARKTGEYQELP
jgi:hypothetical protein